MVMFEPKGGKRGEKRMGKYLKTVELTSLHSKKKYRFTVFSRVKKHPENIYSTYRCFPQGRCPLYMRCGRLFYGPYVLEEELDAFCITVNWPCVLKLVKREVLKKRKDGYYIWVEVK